MPTPADVAHAFPPVSAMTAEEEDAYYPSSDGRPMAENMWQAEAILNAAIDLRAALPGALVAADILLYPEEGNRSNSIAPDVLVALGLGMEERYSYRVWREGKLPDWVLEVASPSTAADDVGDKRRRYAKMGIPEYWLFDPQGGLYPSGTPRLMGLELAGKVYKPITSRVAGGLAVIRSDVLSLDLRQDGKLLRFRDVATGKDIPHHDEKADRGERETARAEREAALRRAADARTAQEAAQRRAADARAEREAARAEREAERADRETTERKAAQVRVAELEAALRQAQAGSSEAS